MSQTRQYSIELLAPARNADVAIAALRCGADAVYIGASSHGARAAAANSVADIASVCEYAHQYNARVYVTLNTLIYENELRDVERLVAELYRAEVDALIVQDLGILRLDIPPIALHASTQCDIRTPQKASFLQELGFSQLVLPRELSLDEIREMHRVVNVPLEAFVHGALCVSYSGDCRASLMCGGRSANRGECAQICRLPYNLTDSDGNIIMRDKHLLSLRDLNRLDDLEQLIGAGISSLKIEGRLKDENYVKNVVSAYDCELRRIGVSRTSDGRVERSFTPDVNRSFNRGFTRLFLFGGMPPKGSLANFSSPKSLGHPVATVSAVKGKTIYLKKVFEPLANGDGLNYTAGEKTVGFRINRFEQPNIIHVNEPLTTLHPGATLRRNFDKGFADTLSVAKYAVRYIPIRMTLRSHKAKVILEADNRTAVVVELPEIAAANSPQGDTHRKILGKLGDTIYRLENLDDRIADKFIPASILADLRRKLVEQLDCGRAARFNRPLRLPENFDAKWPDGNSLTFHDNIANTLALAVYRDHGVTGNVESAMEIDKPGMGATTVMTTRYCLRRELGACLKTEAGRTLPRNLELRAEKIPALTLDFDCNNCQMHVKIRNFAPDGIN